MIKTTQVMYFVVQALTLFTMQGISHAQAIESVCENQGIVVGHHGRITGCECHSVIYAPNDPSNPCSAYFAQREKQADQYQQQQMGQSTVVTVEKLEPPINLVREVNFQPFLDSVRPKILDVPDPRDFADEEQKKPLLLQLHEARKDHACPTEPADINLIAKIYLEGLRTGLATKVDYQRLSGRHYNWCGYNESNQKWFKGTVFYNSAFLYTHTEPGIVTKFAALRNRPYEFRPSKYSVKDSSTNQKDLSGKMGNSILMPIGDGFYVRAYFPAGERNKPFAYALEIPEVP